MGKSNQTQVSTTLGVVIIGFFALVFGYFVANQYNQNDQQNVSQTLGAATRCSVVCLKTGAKSCRTVCQPQPKPNTNITTNTTTNIIKCNGVRLPFGMCMPRL